MLLLCKLQEETYSSRFPKACDKMPLLSVGQHQVGCKQILTSPHCIKLTRSILVLCLPVAHFFLTKALSLAKVTITLLGSVFPTEKCPPVFEMFGCRL